jgi:hypothetical protein
MSPGQRFVFPSFLSPAFPPFSLSNCIWLTTAPSPRLGGALRDENPLLQPDFVKAALGDEG